MGTYAGPGISGLDSQIFSSYALKWQRQMTHGAATIWVMILDILGEFAHIIDNLGWLSLYRLSDGAETVVGAGYATWFAYNQFSSVRDRYQAHLGPTGIEIYRAGSLVATISPAPGWMIAMWAISPDGRYLIVVDYSGAAPYWVRCYEGQ